MALDQEQVKVGWGARRSATCSGLNPAPGQYGGCSSVVERRNVTPVGGSSNLLNRPLARTGLIIRGKR